MRRIVLAGLAAVSVIAIGGCGKSEEAAAPAPTTAPTTTVPPRPMTDYLVTAGDTPGVTYVLPPATDAMALGMIGFASAQQTPECQARNTAIKVINSDPYASALARVDTADGRPRYDVQIAVVNRAIDTTALADAMHGCAGTGSRMVFMDGAGKSADPGFEIPVTRDIADIGPVVEMPLMRELGSRATGTMPSSGLIKFATVGSRTAIVYITGKFMSAEIPADSIAFGDRVLTAQVAKLRAH
ncbi:hypothetical protein AB0L82_05530 [Nocardia sp. NPDC052001]|uniref:hypothetical protein n=1 Tax=Nocardia sp. NPDC052001 TaxID=3154853 RepID=UPI00344658CE